MSVVLIVAVAAIGALSGTAHASSVALGGAFMLGNFHLLRMLVSRLIRPASGRGQRWWAIVVLALKSLLAVLLVAAVVFQFPVAPLSFAFGASMLLVAAVLEAVLLGEPVSGAADAET